MVKHYAYNFNKNNHLVGVMVSMLTSIEVDCRFHHLTSQTKDYNNWYYLLLFTRKHGIRQFQ